MKKKQTIKGKLADYKKQKAGMLRVESLKSNALFGASLLLALPLAEAAVVPIPGLVTGPHPESIRTRVIIPNLEGGKLEIINDNGGMGAVGKSGLSVGRYNTYSQVERFFPSDSVAPGQDFYGNGNDIWFTIDSTYGQFTGLNGDEAYFGFRVPVTGGHNYGFIKIKFTAGPPVAPGMNSSNTIEIIEGFYETTTNMPITIGGSAVPTVSVAPISASSSTVENSGTPLKFTFTLSATAASTTTVKFEISGGTAAAGDFAVQTGGTYNVTFGNTVANQGTIDIPNGGTTAELDIIPSSDAIIEENETVVVKVLPE